MMRRTRRPDFLVKSASRRFALRPREVPPMLKLPFAAVAAVVFLLAGAAPARPATTQPASFTVDLGDGGTLEVVYLAEHKPGGRAWAADGTPLPGGRPFEETDFSEQSGLIEVGLRHNSPAGESFVSWTINPLEYDDHPAEILTWPPHWDTPAATADSKAAYEQGKLRVLLARIDPKITTFALRTEAPLAGWRPLYRWSNIGMSENGNWMGGRVPAVGGTGPESRPVAGGKSWLITQWYAAGFTHWQFDVRVLLRDGTLVTPGGSQFGGEAGQLTIGRAILEDKTRDDVRYFELRGRPYGEVMLTGLAARPGVKAAPQGAPAEPQERPDAAHPPLAGVAPFPKDIMVQNVPLESLGFASSTWGPTPQVAVDRALLGAAGIDANKVSCTLDARAGEPVLATLRRAVERADRRLTVKWRNGRFVVTLADDASEQMRTAEPAAGL